MKLELDELVKEGNWTLGNVVAFFRATEINLRRGGAYDAADRARQRADALEARDGKILDCEAPRDVKRTIGGR